MKLLNFCLVIISLPQLLFAGINLVSNYTFEIGSGNTPDYWRAKSIEGAVLKWEDEFSRTGEKCVSVKRGSGDGDVYWEQVLKLERNRIYTFTGYSYCNDGKNVVKLDVRYWINGTLDGVGARYWVNDIPGLKTWRKITYRFAVPPDADSVSILLQHVSGNDTVYFDDIEITETSFNMQRFGINCGSDGAAADVMGTDYLADIEYSAEAGYGHIGRQEPPDITKTCFYSFSRDEVPSVIGQSSIYGFDEYRIGLENGFYAARLYMSETYFHQAGERVMDIRIEDSLVLKDFDIHAMAGRAYIVPYRFLVDVKDNRLDIEFRAKIGRTTLSGIEIIKIGKDEKPPSKPYKVSAIGGYNQNILQWNTTSEDDLEGFRIYRKVAGGEFELLNEEAEVMSKYIDNDVEAGVEYTYQVSAVDLWGNECDPVKTGTVVPVRNSESNLRVIELKISDENLRRLNSDVFADEYVDAIFTCEGDKRNVEVRYRGGATRNMHKKNFKVRFDEEYLFEGVEKLNLSSCSPDNSFIKEEFINRLRRSAGLLTQETYYVHLVVNGEYEGVYYNREQEDEHFIKNHNLDNSNIYRVMGSPFIIQTEEKYYYSGFDKETGDESDYSDIIELITITHTDNDEDFKKRISKILDIEQYLTMWAVGNICTDVDQTWHNHLLIHDLHTNLWSQVNYDQNYSFVNYTYPVLLNSKNEGNIFGYHPLFSRLMEFDEYRYLFLDIILDITKNHFQKESIDSITAELYDYLKFDVYRDINKINREISKYFDFDISKLKNFCRGRYDFIIKEAEELIPEYTPTDSIRMNEIKPSNRDSVGEGIDLPWIEIYNKSCIPVDLTGLSLRVDEENSERWYFPQGTKIAPYGFLLIRCGEKEDSLDQDLYSGLDLDNSGGKIILSNSDSEELDIIKYPEISDAYSYGRVYDGADNLMAFKIPTPGKTNTPVKLPIVYINEFMASNSSSVADETGAYADWIELYNPGVDDADISHYYITDDKYYPYKYFFPEGTVVPAEGYLTMWADEETRKENLHVGIKLNKAGEKIILLGPEGRNIIDSVGFAEQQEDVSYGRETDGALDWIFFKNHTFNKSNGLSEKIYDIVINEFMASNKDFMRDEHGHYHDWIEIHNRTAKNADLSGYYLSDKPDETCKWVFPDGSVIPPNGYIVLWACGEDNSNKHRTNFKLSSEGEFIGLYSPSTQSVIDSVSFPGQEPDISFGRDCNNPNQWVKFDNPTPRASNCAHTATEKGLLGYCYPNPADERAVIPFKILNDGKYSLTIFDIYGKTVKILFDKHLSPGDYEIKPGLADLSTGTYYYRLSGAGIDETKILKIVR